MTRSAAYFVIPGDINQPTGGYGYDRQVLAHAAQAGVDLIHLPVPGGYPNASDAVLRETVALIASTPADAPLLIDGLAFGAMPAAMIAQFNRRIVALCHHPLALEPGISANDAVRFEASEKAALALARHVIVTGGLTAKTLAKDFAVPPGKITVAEPGTDPAPRAKGSGDPVPRLLTVGSVIPRKGYDVLIGALAAIRDSSWTLDLVGSLAHSPATVEAVRNLIQAHGLENRVRVVGAVDTAGLAQYYDRADVFVLSSHYEGYGMVIAEAMARGLPIVTTAAGAVADTLDPRAGILVPVNSIQELADAIHEMIVNPSKRSVYSDGSWVAGQQLPRWHDTATKIGRVLDEVRS